MLGGGRGSSIAAGAFLIQSLSDQIGRDHQSLEPAIQQHILRRALFNFGCTFSHLLTVDSIERSASRKSSFV
jgi:hypothetical protein